MRQILTISKMTCVQITRSPFFGFLLFFGVLVIAASGLLANFSLQEKGKYLRDIGFACLVLFTTISVLFISIYNFYEEFESRIFFMVRQQPIPDWKIIVGKFFGIVKVVTRIFIFLSIIFLLALILQTDLPAEYSLSKDISLWAWLSLKARIAVQENFFLWPGIFIIFLQSILVLSISLFFSVHLKPLWNLSICISLILAGHLLLAIVSVSHENYPVWTIFINGIRYLMPNFVHYNVIDEVVLGKQISNTYLVWVSLYTFFYATLVLGAASLSLKHKQF